ncbi:MAG TPA: hypothetical protein VHC90_22125 [Bryobacteraceae bacterium]|nr:hypothetical protein [Bryobacteraceae bacterium]
MSTFKVLLLLALVIAAVAYGLHSRTEAGKRPVRTFNAVAIDDNSDSQPTDCAKFAAMVADHVEPMENRTSKSALYILSLGSPKTSFEPVPEATIPIPPSAGTNFGGKTDIYGGAKVACERMKPVPLSPIYRAVEVGLQIIKTRGSGGIILLSSDGEETTERRYFGATKVSPPSLINDNVRFLMCGYAATLVGGGPRSSRTGQLLDQWRQRFSQPALVTFEPYCFAPPREAEDGVGKVDRHE